MNQIGLESWVSLITTISADTLGSIAMDVIAGDKALTSVDTRLKNAVEEFNSTLAHFSHDIGFRTFELGSETLDVVHGRTF